MPYELFFREEIVPTIGVRVRHADWRRLEFTAPETSNVIERCLAMKAKWYPVHPDAGAIGYNGCGMLERVSDAVEVSFHLLRETLPCAMLTFSFLLEDLELLQSREFRLKVGCVEAYKMIEGAVSEQFRKRVKRLSPAHTESACASMRNVWRSVAPRDLYSQAKECGATIHADGRFMLRCSGDACDAGLYPQYPSSLSCHNVGSYAQLVTLLTGIISITQAAEKNRR